MNPMIPHAGRSWLQRLGLWLLPAVFLMLSGCATGKTTLRQVQMQIGWKSEAFQQAVIHDRVTLGQQQAVQSAQKAYTAAFQRALQAAHGNLDTPAPDDVLNLGTEVLREIDGAL